ncbi:hypothetical protein BGZ79_001482 [Entomortierella chlamydospora]|nr:hypothetical protein BGZ79_001482 [Entomortierella chlamydospora]
MSFTLETTLDTKISNVIEFLGPPSSAVQHEIPGTILLRIQKAVVIKQLVVAFNGEAHANYSAIVGIGSSDAVNICRVENNLINAPTQYLPGDYTFAFRLSLPGDLATTDSTQLKSNGLLWAYELVTSAVPSGLFIRRKVLRQSVKLKRVHVPPSEISAVRYGAKRLGDFECSLYAPKFISSQETKMNLKAFLHPFNHSHKVKEVLVQAIQTEKVDFDVDSALRAQEGQFVIKSRYDVLNCPPVKFDEAKPFSEILSVQNPDQEEFTSEWGRECAVEFELNIEPRDILPSESLEWMKISHGIRFTIVFADPSIRPLNVMAPLQVFNIIDELWTNSPVPDGLTPPDYGIGDDHSTLLDSNTSRLTRQQLRDELYPEREPIVPDLADDLPPVYDQELERPLQYSEKIS